MPSSRPRCQPSLRAATWKRVEGRAYLAAQAQSKRVWVDTKVDNIPNRYPHVDGIFDEASDFQRHVHDIYVELIHGRRRDIFQIFFKRHVRLQPNGHVEDLAGDIIVMRISARDEKAVVNARRGDKVIMDYILECVADRLKRFQGPQRTRLPAMLTLERDRAFRRR
uniref:Uncharacterized protein n=1 Tax=Mycena chlorophos TaxID=658473 RepID=A0ABQ0KX94_MYCCL|nr:predicted protein [Mycena chlorophos]